LIWSNRLTEFFWYGSITLEWLLCARLLIGAYWRRYPWFTLFVAVLGAESVVLAVIRLHVDFLYGPVWIFTRGFALLLELLAVIEIFSGWSRNFPGIESFGRKLFVGLTSVALAAAASTLPADATRAGWVFAYQLTSVVNREIHLLSSVFLALMIGFFAYFGGPIAPNLRRHTWLMLWFLSATCLSYLLTTVSRQFWLADILFAAASFSALIGWLLAFRKGMDRRERKPVSAEEMEEYEAAEALSQKLVRFGRKITLRGLLGLKKKT